MMRRQQTTSSTMQALQPELFPDGTFVKEALPEVAPDVTKLPEEAKPVEQDGTLVSTEPETLDLLTYNRESLRYQGPHDQARRAWLREWAQAHNWPRSWFTMHGKYSGYYKTCVLPGGEGWTGFLEKAVQYDIYCMFVAAFTPGIPLEHYLQDASQRGEIRW